MKTRFGTIFAAAAVGAAVPPPLTAETPLAVSPDFVYAADARGALRAVTTAQELEEITGGTFRAAWRRGERVTLVAPDGSETRLSDGSSSGTATLPVDAGGCWTLVNSRAGESEITVRYSLYGSAGDGTEDDPLKLVDDDEIAAVSASDLIPGFFIALRGTPELDLTSLPLGSGLSLTGLGNGVWRVDAAENGSVAVSAQKVFEADSMPSPRTIKTAEDVAALWRVTRRAGETVTLVSPDGSVDTLIPAGSAETDAALPVDAGGLWTVVNSKQGTAMFTVRHSLYGTLGGGTAESPAKIVDADELLDYSAGDGYVFTLEGAGSLVDALVLPDGFRMEKIVGDGTPKWRIGLSVAGEEFVSDGLVYSVDSGLPGPDRRLYFEEIMPVAYSGDNWTRVSAAASVLTITSPSGNVSGYDMTGTGAVTAHFDEVGRWSITLETSGGAVTAFVDVAHRGLSMIIR